MLDKPTFAWGEETVNLLRVSVANGLSSGEAVCVFADRYRGAPSRSAIIGKAARLHLSFGMGRTSAPRIERERQRFPWSSAADARLRALVIEGKSTREIIEELARVFYAAPRPSESAIRSRALKIGVSLRGDRPPRQTNSAPESLPPTKAQDESGREDPMQRLPSAIIPENGGVTLLELQHDACRWPYGDPRDLDTFRYCGAAAETGRPYCAGHLMKSFDQAALARSKQRAKDNARKAARAALERPLGRMGFAFGGVDG